MSTMLTITAKGQVTLRKEVLEHLGLGPGDRVVVELVAAGRVELRRPPAGTIDDFIGALPDRGVRATIEEINQAIEKGWSGR